MTLQLFDFSNLFLVLNGTTAFLGIAITLGTYFVSTMAYRAIGEPVYLHPLLIAIVGLAGLLHVLGISYEQYFRAAEPLHLLLSPVVVLLAVPLWRQLGAIRALGPSLIVVLIVGASTGIVTSAGVALLLAGPDNLVATLAPKSVTTPVAINLSESLGGIPAITALVVALTGLVGATLGWPMLQVIGNFDLRAKGFAIGLSAHVIGTARVFQIDEKAGAFSSLGMILNAIVTAALIGLAAIVI